MKDPNIRDFEVFMDENGLSVEWFEGDELGDYTAFDFAKAVYYIACHFHGGQWTNLYEAIEKSGYRPGPFERQLPDFENDPIASELYTRMAEWIRK